ncbi:MAG TPA: insulinase family protein [Firmicutes bacterium]|nr:insulinase family protein [Bacillota bacterium]
MEKIVLDNGLRVLLLPLAGFRSASVDVWVAAGSRHEREPEQGISHFIEHMLFKGTARRSARDISEEMDRLGGSVNAYTAKEYTRYYCQCLGESAVPALDILCDMLASPRLDPAEMERERGVILDEMAMYEDSGEDVAHEALCAAVWPHSPLGRAICGLTETVATLTAEDLRRYMRRHYTPERMVAVAAGRFDREGVLRLLRDTLGALPRGEGVPQPDAPAFTPSLALKPKEFEQTSLVLATPGLPAGDPRRYAMSLLNFIVGGGASSRLFQRLREELGLAYSVYSASYASRGAGLFTVAASFSADRQEQVLSELQAVLRGLPGSISEEEFARARAQVKASFILGLETVASQASYAGRNELLEGREIPPEEAIAALERLTAEDVNALADELLRDPRRALSVAGEIRGRAFYEPFLKP